MTKFMTKNKIIHRKNEWEHSKIRENEFAPRDVLKEKVFK